MNVACNKDGPPEPGEPFDQPSDRDARAELSGPVRQIEWQALRGRLFAAAEASACPSIFAPRLQLHGSFDGAAASSLVSYQGSLTTINPDGSSNSKSMARNDPWVTDMEDDGERG